MTIDNMVMYINWLTDLNDDARMMVMTLMILLCVMNICSVCLLSMPACLGFLLFWKIAILAFVITVSFHQDPFFSDPLLTILFLVL